MPNRKPVRPAHSYPIATGQPVRIVPMPHVVKATLAAVQAQQVTPQLTYNDGPLLANVEVFTVFWGSAWGQGDLADLATAINGFFQFIVTSPLIDQLAEYQVPAFPIGEGPFTGSATPPTKHPPPPGR